jgi:predicted transcriptional regulator
MEVLITNACVGPVVMSTTQFGVPARLDVPDSLEASESKLVYLFLRTTGGATVEDLHETLDIRKISLYPVLDTLADRDLITREGDAYVAA